LNFVLRLKISSFFRQKKNSFCHRNKSFGT